MNAKSERDGEAEGMDYDAVMNPCNAGNPGTSASR